MRKLSACCIAASLFLTSAALAQDSSGSGPTLAELQEWHADRPAPAELGEMRRQLLRDTAMQVCSSAALARRTRQLNARFERHADALDQVYRFDQLTIHDGLVMPPVILEAHDRASLQGRTLRRISRSYRMVNHAQLLTRAPDWRMWLLENYSDPVPPDEQLLPAGTAQRRVWSAACEQGWRAGQEQALEVARLRLVRMQQAFVGVIRYHLLRSLNMVTEPRIRERRKGVRVTDSELRIGEVQYRLSTPSRFRRSDWEIHPQLPSLFDALAADLAADER